MTNEKLVLHSARGGLWARLITQFLAYWLGFYWFVIVILALIPNLIIYGIISLVGLLIVCYFSYKLLRDHPFTWPKAVEFDFVEGIITIPDGHDTKQQRDILDTPDRTILFSDIDHLHGEPYESVILSSVYRLSVVCNGQKIKLVALKSPNDYTYLIGQFNRHGLRVR